MDRVTIYLRTALFTLPEGGHAPLGSTILEAEILDRPQGGLVVRVARFLDHRGKALAGESVTLMLPWAKIDHMAVLSE